MFNIIYYIVYIVKIKGGGENLKARRSAIFSKKNNNKKIFFSFLKKVYKKCRLCYYNPNRNL